MRKTPAFEIGEGVGYFRVKQVLGTVVMGKTAKEEYWNYLVECTICGAEYDRSERTLKCGVRRGNYGCQKCGHTFEKERRRKAAAGEENKPLDEEAVEAALDALAKKPNRMLHEELMGFDPEILELAMSKPWRIQYGQ